MGKDKVRGDKMKNTVGREREGARLLFRRRNVGGGHKYMCCLKWKHFKQDSFYFFRDSRAGCLWRVKGSEVGQGSAGEW